MVKSLVLTFKKEITRPIAVKHLDDDYEEKVKERIAVDKELQLYLRDEYFSFLQKMIISN